ncbi:unnamed protein product [Toxocara canis]|uniref:Uncharacterized protein n=1 Tax=Toxocara canis TaxID=6265 RepID=A0A3P7G6T4_TOXCA|nr:unnamed protein product [Toxocara canis]
MFFFFRFFPSFPSPCFLSPIPLFLSFLSFFVFPFFLFFAIVKCVSSYFSCQSNGQRCFGSRCSSDRIERIESEVRGPGRRSRDEELARQYALPVSAAQIASMPLSELNRMMQSAHLTQTQQNLVRKIRRRGMFHFYLQARSYLSVSDTLSFKIRTTMDAIITFFDKSVIQFFSPSRNWSPLKIHFRVFFLSLTLFLII